MIKTTSTLVAILLFSLFSFSQDNGNFILTINNESINIDLNETSEYKTNSGEVLSICLTQPDILTYSDDIISFNYSKEMSVSNSKIDEGIEQCALIQSTGNGFLVQKYTTIDPTSLTRLMVHELTKESVNYGYEKTEKPFKLKLSSGQTIEGIEATLTYNGTKEIYTIATYGEKDKGIIVVTMLLDVAADDTEMIDLFLNSLRIL